MKLLLMLVLFAAIVNSAAAQAREQAQETEPRNLKLVVRNTRGKVMTDLSLVAQIKGQAQAQKLDKFGNRFFKVADSDTLMVVVADKIWEFPVDGLDSLCVVFKNRSTVAGYVRPDSGGELVNVGYGTVTKRNNLASVATLDMQGAYAYSDLKSYIVGRVAGVNFVGDQMVIRGVSTMGNGIEPLIVLNGVPLGNSFAAANNTINPQDVASISILKDAAATSIYGSRGGNGVVLITTKTGADAKKK